MFFKYTILIKKCLVSIYAIIYYSKKEEYIILLGLISK